MTVAVMVKVFDGVVLAADSATTFPLTDGSGTVVSHQVYNSANKIFQLHRGLPVGAATWGLGALGNASISTLAKDLRTRLMGLDDSRSDWALDPSSYTVEQVAHRLVELFFDELFGTLYTAPSAQPLGFVVAGYGAAATAAEAWTIEIRDPNQRPAPVSAAGVHQSGWAAYAQSAPVQRLFNGYDNALLTALAGKIDPDDAAALLSAQTQQPAAPGMPFMDAISLAGFMVDVTIGYTRYIMGPDTVGGPVEIAGISRHEGFKWVSRKHYYSQELNPGSTT